MLVPDFLPGKSMSMNDPAYCGLRNLYPTHTCYLDIPLEDINLDSLVLAQQYVIIQFSKLSPRLFQSIAWFNISISFKFMKNSASSTGSNVDVFRNLSKRQIHTTLHLRSVNGAFRCGSADIIVLSDSNLPLCWLTAHCRYTIQYHTHMHIHYSVQCHLSHATQYAMRNTQTFERNRKGLYSR